jgi:hypothetical protein
MTKQEAAIVAIGCIVCRRQGMYTQAIPHHVRKLRTSKKRKNAPCIGLCPVHHQGHGWGISLHDGEQEFERRYGSVDGMLEEVKKLLDTKQ